LGLPNSIISTLYNKKHLKVHRTIPDKKIREYGELTGLPSLLKIRRLFLCPKE